MADLPKPYRERLQEEGGSLLVNPQTGNRHYVPNNGSFKWDYSAREWQIKPESPPSEAPETRP